MTRAAIYELLKRATKTSNNTELMNELQNLHLVSDECETIEQVVNSDLMRAYNAVLNDQMRDG